MVINLSISLQDGYENNLFFFSSINRLLIEKDKLMSFYSYLKKAKTFFDNNIDMGLYHSMYGNRADDDYDITYN